MGNRRMRKAKEEKKREGKRKKNLDLSLEL